jgi:hypothetical protein
VDVKGSQAYKLVLEIMHSHINQTQLQGVFSGSDVHSVVRYDSVEGKGQATTKGAFGLATASPRGVCSNEHE